MLFFEILNFFFEDNFFQNNFNFQSSRFYPSSISAIEWLGAYYAEMQVPEKAIQHYERAALAQPKEPRWPLLIASCLRRGGNHQEAVRHYQAVLHKFPDNLECEFEHRERHAAQGRARKFTKIDTC